MESTETNKLITQFRGIELVKRNDEDAVFCSKHAAFPEYFRCTAHNTYHSDWNMLMLAVNKIESIKEDGLNWTYCVTIERGHCCISRHGEDPIVEVQGEDNDKLGVTYRAVVKFIEWYNSTNKK